MDAPITAAVIGATATVTGTLATVLMKYWETRKLPYIPTERRNAVVGTWMGDSQQERGPDGKPYFGKVKFVFALKGKRVIGTGEYSGEWDDKPYVMHLKFTGGFLHTKFLRLEYDPSETSHLQFGSILLELGNKADSISGRYLGFGPYSNAMVWGTVNLKKCLA